MAVTSPISTAPRSIILKGNPEIREGTVATGVTTLKPGMLVDFDANGVKLGTADMAGFMVAVESDLEGYDIDDTFAAGQSMRYAVLKPGDEAYCYVAVGQDISIGEQVEAGAGMLVTDSAAAGATVLGIAKEAVDLTGSPAPAAARIRVMAV